MLSPFSVLVDRIVAMVLRGSARFTHESVRLWFRRLGVLFQSLSGSVEEPWPWTRQGSAETSLGVDYPQGLIKEPGKVVLLLESFPNIRGDLSAFSGYNAISRDPDFGKIFLEKFKRKLLYGTDLEAFFSPQHSLLDLLRNMNLSDECCESIFHKNLEEILP